MHHPTCIYFEGAGECNCKGLFARVIDESPTLARVEPNEVAIALGALPMASWLPMESAPKPDRDATTPPTWILVDHEDFVLPIFAYWETRLGGNGHWRDDLGRIVRREPRGWQPVPERWKR